MKLRFSILEVLVTMVMVGVTLATWKFADNLSVSCGLATLGFVIGPHAGPYCLPNAAPRHARGSRLLYQLIGMLLGFSVGEITWA